MSKVVGILGGMGPEATVDLFAKIVKNTPARRDQDHLRIVVEDDPSIPDRTAAIFEGGPDPLPAMLEAGRRLIGAGADFIVIPCNTAHHFYERLAGRLPVPVLHIMEETARFIARDHPAARRIGLLATTGTVWTGLYDRALAKRGLTVLHPAPAVQEQIMEAIYGRDGIKAGHYDRPRELLTAAGRSLVESGADVVVAGCTEIPLVLKPGLLPVPVIDATEALALAAVTEALDGVPGGGERQDGQGRE